MAGPAAGFSSNIVLADGAVDVASAQPGGTEHGCSAAGSSAAGSGSAAVGQRHVSDASSLLWLVARQFSERVLIVDGLAASFEPVDSNVCPRALPHVAAAADAVRWREVDGAAAEPGQVAPSQAWQAEPVETPGSITVNLAWTVVKVDADHLAAIGTALAQAAGVGPTAAPPPTVTLRLFAALPASRAIELASLRADVSSALGLASLPNVRLDIVPGLAYGAFVRALSLGAFAVDSLPLAGCNSMHDLLHAGVPTVTLEGRGWRGRIGAAMLRRLGLHWLVADSVGDFQAKIARLVTDLPWRREMRRRVALADLSVLQVTEAEGLQWRAGLATALELASGS
ncbi:hypothetical protein FNF28_03518 [Cafeteria roenbergensis]|uniref:O-GlcNAc transferase C-terminal domain-containing protein n=1 Tax=Cafeteria roenbergensis TaxID=33653 RepID=A0A5A8DKR1_CAFRO|nr:hypothetical protein FNF28_03518 [Cafeteria roenbergensis]